MFCPKCGAQNPENSPFCAGCGAPLEEETAPVTPTRPAGSGASAPAGDKKKLGIIIAAAVAVIALIVILAVTLSGRSYKKTVKQYCSAMTNGNYSKIVKLIPKSALEEALDEEDMDMDDLMDELEDREEDYQDMLDDLDDDEIPSVSYEIKDTDDLKKKEYKDLEDRLDDDFDLEIDDAMEVEIEVAYEFEDEDDNYDFEKTLVLVKIGRSWYLTPYILYDFM